jgi:acyl-CoA thioesterase-1
MNCRMNLWVLAKYLLSACILLCTAYVIAEDVSGMASGRKNGKILFLGDSLTAGYGLDVSASYPSIIQGYISQKGFDYEVVNAGVSGDTTAGGLRRLEWLLREDVSVLVIALGANDGLRGFDPSVSRSNLEKIIDAARAHSGDIRILFAGMYAPPNMGEEYGKNYERMFREVAEKKEVQFLPFLLEGVAGEPLFNLSDGIHPNEEGYQKVADHVWKHLEPLLLNTD